MSRPRSSPNRQRTWLRVTLRVAGLALVGWAAMLVVTEGRRSPPAALPMLLAGTLLLLSMRRRGAGRAEASEPTDEDSAVRPDATDPAESAAVPLEIGDAIDLHGFAPRDVVSVVESYLEAAHERGLREVRLIHGRGKGVQRARVQSLLARHPLVERFASAPPSRGGWGATIAWLVPPAQPRESDRKAGSAEGVH